MASHFFSGVVDRLYVRGTPNAGCMIRLDSNTVKPAGEDLPEHGYFYLNIDHVNYQALYSLALLAASGRHRLQVRTTEDADPSTVAEISYLRLDW